MKPKVICAADPIFHAGPSSYAAAFRENLLAKMREYEFHLFVPMRDYLIYIHFLPKEFHSRLIGVPLRADGMNLNMKTDFYVDPLPNVLTLLMIPIGGSCYDEMTISGCDGRPLDENQYFWGHHKGSQINDKMADIKVAHPGFFNISYDDYYSRHCDQVEEILQRYEAKDGIAKAGTASFLPALRKRGAAEPIRQTRHSDPNSQVTLLSLNPDLSGEGGHYWNYEAKLSEVVLPQGYAYRVAGNGAVVEAFNKTLDEDGTFKQDGMVIDPCLATNSYSLANRKDLPQATLDELAELVEEEFINAIDRARAQAPGDLIIYQYTGGLEHLEIIHRLLAERPDTRAIVNLFWMRSADVWQPEFATRYGPLLEIALGESRLSVTAMTQHQADAIEKRTGLKLPVAAHPSPLIGDAVARNLIDAGQTKVTAERSADRPLKIFFPSANRIEKGSKYLKDVAIELSSLLYGRNYELVFRTPPLPETASADEKKALGKYHLMTGNIEEDVFIQTLADSDIVVLPYLPPSFADRTSGLAVDAIYAGTPIVVMGGTWLSALAESLNAGKVVNLPSPTSIARAVYDLVLDIESEVVDVAAGARKYLEANSWDVLAKEVLTGPHVSPEERWSSDDYAMAEELRDSASPILGRVDRGARGVFDPLAMAVAVLPEAGDAKLIVNAMGQPSLVKQAQNLTGNFKVDVLEPSPSLFGLASRLLSEGSQTHSWRIRQGGGNSPESIAQFLADALASKEPTEAFAYVDNAANGNSLTLMKSSLSVQKADCLIFGYRPEYVVRPGAAALQMAGFLTEQGYKVVLNEYWEPELSSDRWDFKRAVLHPYMVALPMAPCDVIAVKSDLSLEDISALYQETTQNTEFRETRTAEAIAQALWDSAPTANPAHVVHSIVDPKSSECDLASLKAEELDADGYRVVSESSELRVHRATFKSHPSIGLPMTLSFDVKATNARYLTVWFTDKDYKRLAEATFDLNSGRVLVCKSASGLVEGDPFAGIVEVNHDRGKVAEYHIWFSVEGINSDQLLLSHIIPLKTSAGSARFEGRPDSKFGLREIMLRKAAGPARFIAVPKVASVETVAPLKPVTQLNAIVESPSEDSKVSDAPQVSRVDVPEKLGQSQQVFPKNKEGRFGINFMSSHVKATQHDLQVEVTSQRILESTPTYFNLIERDLGEDPSKFWIAGTAVKCNIESGLIALDRNKASHQDQLYTLVETVPGGQYELKVMFKHIKPRCVILIDGRLVLDLTSPQEATLKFRAGSSKTRIEFKGVDSPDAKLSLEQCLVSAIN